MSLMTAAEPALPLQHVTEKELSRMIRAEGLTKKYGELVAVDNLTLSVGPGEVFGFLGPNGSGKTTTINSI